jgi:superfamily II DNA or RNA helicase
METYIGPRGYTIYKKDLTAEQVKMIKTELTAKPAINTAMGGQAKTFPVYRESHQKYYLPRIFGVKNFGPPKAIKMHEGNDVDIEFKGGLRADQVPIVEKFVNHAKQHGCGLLELYCGFGKTVLALNIISKLKKKTLIIVHKEFLLNQWVERIGQFLPGARVGRIQGQTIDVENKDIVIGMLQSLSMKDYDDGVFSEFGFTVVDECHHILAEVFSNSLFKIVTKYMLGLSATMNRKDGMTKVFKMFLGDVVVKVERKNESNVLVKGIEYRSHDSEFEETELNFKGQPHYSKMIGKLCTYNPRCEFILKVLVDVLSKAKANAQKIQVMMLAHNKNILKYMYDAIEHRKIGTVGYYVGGMKEKDLKETESKEIVIATYAMAEEALDIKTLTTLVMMTPKTDVTQAVGRILRVKHDHPLVIDIVDTHDTFKRQWYKRRSLYKKADYRVEWTNSDAYFDETVDEEESEYSGSDDDITIETETNTKFAKNRILTGSCLMEDD